MVWYLTDADRLNSPRRIARPTPCVLHSNFLFKCEHNPARFGVTILSSGNLWTFSAPLRLTLCETHDSRREDTLFLRAGPHPSLVKCHGSRFSFLSLSFPSDYSFPCETTGTLRAEQTFQQFNIQNYFDIKVPILILTISMRILKISIVLTLKFEC